MPQKNVLLGLIALAVASSVYGEDIKKVLEQPLVIPAPNVVVTSMVITFPPGDEGSAPHYHSGPVVGHVLKGSFLFQVGDESPRIIPAGESFYEVDRITHVWFANASDNSTCEILGTILGRPGKPIITFVDGVNRPSRAEAIELARAASKVNPSDCPAS
ncbi:uncharacterized protein LOC119071015 [Bradysia coprophila]|uniref:uncharacterized protein LOC119071015 n=1 Tax=Bradysia coprophila TaxID=38358 RepID=UPI00187D94E6|nr:uncharacterized protein LOC119071015 [Bradysia coprophila]